MNLNGLIVCPLKHSVKSYIANPAGMWLRGNDELFVLLIQGDGRAKFRMQCRRCGQRSSDIPKQVAHEWRLFERQQPFDLVDCRPPNQYPPCTYIGCPNPGRENHHFAPYNTFGEDADSWPIMPLCPDHHNEWHVRMDGYRRTRKTAA